MSKVIALTKDALVQAPAYLLYAILAAACITSWRAAVEFRDLKEAIRKNWTLEMQKEFSYELRVRNPMLNVPEPIVIYKNAGSNRSESPWRLSSR